MIYMNEDISTDEALADVRRHQWESDPPDEVDQ